ncbi:MAG: TAXI family TRAP transporter solute-binding subunit [Rickettsiales bacterium]|nr:TAXI family TRAP transporter solute-binding subunit [Rickettsiales bacterium]
MQKTSKSLNKHNSNFNIIKLVILIFILNINSINAENKIFYIGSGSPNAIFYPIAHSLCKNFNSKQHEYHCIAKVSKGAADNLKNLHNNEIEFGISQASLYKDFYNSKNYTNIIPILGLHKESFSILVNRDSNIKSLKDLKNKNVNIGNIGSGSRVYYEKISKIIGLDKSEFSQIYEEKSGDISSLLCSKKIDAAIYLVGHPNKIFQTSIEECNSKLIGLNFFERYRITKHLPEFVTSKLKNDIYESKEKSIKTVSIPIILSTNTEVSDDLVTKFISISKESLPDLKQENKIFNEINFELP